MSDAAASSRVFSLGFHSRITFGNGDKGITKRGRHIFIYNGQFRVRFLEEARRGRHVSNNNTIYFHKDNTNTNQSVNSNAIVVSDTIW
jgi:hypothetical protein